MKIRLIIISFFLSFSLISIAQDTIKVMQYNLLYYGKDIYDCTSTNNGRDFKNTQLLTILDYAKPDIFCVNEMDASLDDVNYLMDNALNVGGVNYWQHANVSGSFSINMIYFNSEKFTLNSQVSISAYPRQTDVYNMTYNAPSPIDFTIFVAHLKASDDAPSADDRATATQNVMNYIASKGPGNYIFQGDLNLYTSTELAFQNLINPSNITLAFNDPANRIGNWNNNPSFADVHTQATHTSGTCFVTGGMDDRFDFILISNAIKNGDNQIKYLSNSYETIGQDGNHFNDALTDFTNNSAPPEVINALYNMSDHIPVSLNLVMSNGNNNTPITVFNKTFDDQDINSGGWQEFSVTDATRIWNIPTNTFGHNNTYYGMMTGWDYTNNIAVDNEDWLISPTFNSDEIFAETLTFWTSGKYTGDDLQVYYSTDYSGTGDPNLANWQEITGFQLSNTSDYVWESSGNIDLSQISGSNTRIGFKYNSSASNGARTWQIDDILLTGFDGNSSVHEFKPSNIKRFKAFPNPTLKDVNIEFELLTRAHLRFEIYNTNGQMLYQQYIENQNIGTQSFKVDFSLENKPIGLYLLKLSDGQSIKTIKLMKEN